MVYIQVTLMAEGCALGATGKPLGRGSGQSPEEAMHAG